MDPTKKELYGAKRSSGVDISDPEIAAAWDKVKDDCSPEVRNICHAEIEVLISGVRAELLGLWYVILSIYCRIGCCSAMRTARLCEFVGQGRVAWSSSWHC